MPLLLILLFGLPVLGTWISGKSILPYLTFPPRTTQVNPGEVSWILFVSVALTLAITSAPFLWRIMTFSHTRSTKSQVSAFPYWGWLGVMTLAMAWLTAWTRWPWFDWLQFHTFTPLWLSYIVLVNALTLMRTGRCFMVDQPKLFLSLFPMSAAFWWMFEYLNRFVHNWYYLPIREFDALTYLLLGSLSFSTVLPAIYGTYELLMSLQRITDPFTAWWKVSISNVRGVGWALILSGGIGLLGIGFWATLLYPLLWVSPLCILLGFQILQGQESMLEKLRQGDWRPVVIPALAGLLCGFFWELWNSQSLAHWEYAIPYLHTFQIFEMPVLGYAGYLPFGLECLIFIQLLLPRLDNNFTQETPNSVTTMNLKTAWQTPWHHTRNT